MLIAVEKAVQDVMHEANYNFEIAAPGVLVIPGSRLRIRIADGNLIVEEEHPEQFRDHGSPRIHRHGYVPLADPNSFRKLVKIVDNIIHA